MKIKAQVRDDAPVTEDNMRRAVATRQSRTPQAVSVQFLPSRRSLLIGFVDQSAIALPVAKFPELEALDPAELDRLTIGFGGQALCLEERDLHLSIQGMIAVSDALMGLAASMVAASNGRRVSAAKAQAARMNGRKGGRPRKPSVDPST
ncbi:hypothetical protein CS062_19815 [Roseateles chitinivorans]|uniref:DUF2442 domain-containing protein n=1 Tax=Roseateles chitinivorans TaxID=2917965 RepID=A0A2G9C4Q5_9BURK|nr:DUF2442 domain-containing protein [Roseateles chitinivorans]PIM51416.1 hypothetical protein CS062_19815 [Roseateles chitinivorans]